MGQIRLISTKFEFGSRSGVVKCLKVQDSNSNLFKSLFINSLFRHRGTNFEQKFTILGRQIDKVEEHKL